MNTKDYLPLLRFVAHKLKVRHKLPTPLEELVSVGYFGLHEAAQKYDPSKGAFTTYAFIRIRGAILDFAGKEAKHNVLDLTDFQTIPIKSVAPEFDPEHAAMVNELKDRVNQLHGRDREIVYRNYFEDQSYRDLVNIMGIEKSYISRLHAAAIKKLTRLVR